MLDATLTEAELAWHVVGYIFGHEPRCTRSLPPPPRVRYRAPRTPRVLLYAVAAATYIEAELRELEQLARLKQGLREPSLMLHNAGGR